MKRVRLIAVAALLTFVSILEAQQDPVIANTVTLYQLEHKPAKEARRLFDKASRELDKRDYEAGLALLRQATAIDPDYWDVQNDIGYACLQLARNTDAEEAFQRAIDIDPHNPVGYANMGVFALAIQDYKLAEQSALRALKIQPALSRAKALYALSQIRQGRWTAQAHDLLEDAKSVLPEVDSILQVWPKDGAAPPSVTLIIATARPFPKER